jgi:EpsI family protein
MSTSTSRSKVLRGANRLEFPVLFALVAFALCYAGVLASLIDAWLTNPLLSYGFAVPFISGYVAGTRSAEWRGLPRVPDYALGVPVSLVAAALLVVGHLGGLVALQGISLVIAIAGLVLLLCGRRIFRALSFPIAYLLLMVPIWHDPIGRLQIPSQLVSAKIAVELLHVVGVPAFRQGTTIVLPTLTLDVLRECSGVNQLVALMAMVIPAAYLWLPNYTRRILLICIAAVVGYLSNGLRIALLGWLGVKGLSDGDPQGGLHLLQGLGVSVLGYVVIGACVTLLSRTRKADDSPDERQVAEAALNVQAGSATGLLVRRPKLEYAVLIAMLFAASSQLLAARLDVRLTDTLQVLPARIADWSLDTTADGAAARLLELDGGFVGAHPASAARRFTSVDDELVRVYRSPNGTRVELYVGYYRRQEQGKELAGEAGHALHRIASASALRLESETIQLGEILQQTAGTERGLLFWYDVNGRILYDIYVAKGYTIWDALTRRRTNGAVVMIGWVSPSGRAFDAARREAIGFAEALVPVLRKQLPS